MCYLCILVYGNVAHLKSKVNLHLVQRTILHLELQALHCSTFVRLECMKGSSWLTWVSFSEIKLWEIEGFWVLSENGVGIDTIPFLGFYGVATYFISKIRKLYKLQHVLNNNLLIKWEQLHPCRKNFTWFCLLVTIYWQKYKAFFPSYNLPKIK